MQQAFGRRYLARGNYLQQHLNLALSDGPKNTECRHSLTASAQCVPTNRKFARFANDVEFSSASIVKRSIQSEVEVISQPKMVRL